MNPQKDIGFESALSAEVPAAGPVAISTEGKNTSTDKYRIKAFLLNTNTLPLQPATAQREWMQNTAEHFANRCLPLRIANQYGWFVVNDDEIEVIWSGGSDPESLKIHRPQGKRAGPASSHFGHGIVTFQLPYLFRTAPGYNLYVRGPTNLPKDGAHALDGIIETDWAVATFTMNWKITGVGVPVRFAAGEPIAMIIPVERGELEKFEIVVEDIQKEPALHDEHRAWAMSRGQFNLAIRSSPPSVAADRWQKHYYFGRKKGDEPPFEQHQTALQLKPIVDNTGLVSHAASKITVICPDDGSSTRTQPVKRSILRRLADRFRGRPS